MGLYLGKLRIIAINEKIATKQWVTDLGYLSNANLSDYITNEQLQPVSDKIDDVSAKVEDISTKIIKKGTLGTINGKSIEDGNNITIDLSLGGYYTKEQTDEKFLTKVEAGNLADYVKNSELDTKVGEAGYVKTEALTTALTSYAKKTDIPTVPTKLSDLTNDSGYITTYTETDPVWTSEKSNYYTKTEIDNKNYLTEHQSLADYVKTEALTTTLTTYAKKTDIPTVPTKLSELTNDSGYITSYTETDPVWTSEKVNYYTKTEINNKNYLTNSDLSGYGYVTIFDLNTVSDEVDYISTKVEDISTKIIKKGTLGTINGQSIENGNNVTIDLTLFKVVDSLPVSDIDGNKIYLLPNPAGADNNTYIEYMYINGRWEVVGEYKAEMSLENYYTKGQTDEKFLTKAEAGNLADYVKNGELDTKVGEAGYVKTEALTTYAKKTDIPTVPTKLSELVNDSSFITTYTETDPVWTSEKVNYYTKTEIDNKNYLTEHQSLADYAKKSEIPTDYVRNTELADYATKTYVTEQIGSINSVLENI